MARTPSHLTSYAHCRSSAADGSGAGVASIGRIRTGNRLPVPDPRGVPIPAVSPDDALPSARTEKPRSRVQLGGSAPLAADKSA